MKPVLTEQDFEDAATELGCDVAAIKAVCKVEASRGGFNPDGSPVTLFEGHKFHGFTDGRYDKGFPHLSHPKWTRQHYGKNWQAEQSRLQQAMALDRDQALKSASWGKFQIMGFNHKLAGFDSIQQFVNAMYAGEREHLMAFVAFVRSACLVDEIKRRDWTGFARGYNGSAFAENKYHLKLAEAYNQFKEV